MQLKNFLMKIFKPYVICIEEKKLLKNHITIYEFNKGIIQNEYYIHKL